MATTRAAIVSVIESSGVVAVVRLDDAKSGVEVAKALLAGGVTAIEITMTVPNAVALIAELSQALDGALIGAGTVTDAGTAKAVIRAGARFVVSPVFRPEIITACHGDGVPACPGCFTPTEILSAWDAGADVVKVFPSTALGPGYFKDLRGPMPQVKLMPTGGVTLENAADWIRAGAVAIGAGSALVDPKAVAARAFDVITDRAWLENTFVPMIQKRGAAVIEKRGSSSAVSAANGAIDHVKNWLNGTPTHDWVSMATVSRGEYDVPPGLVFGYPCTTDGKGGHSVVTGLTLDEFGKGRFKATQEELETELGMVKELTGAARG